MSKPTICLNMIVKDEAHIILQTLENICSYIPFSYWVICDTGSSDNTKELIIEFFENKRIEGDLLEDTWVDFAHNRSRALEYAYGKTDYIFIFDADDEIVGNCKLPLQYTFDIYNFKFGPNLVYHRPLLINNKKKWCFKGVLHEYLEPLDKPVTLTTIDGDYYVKSGRLGNRNKNPNKYIDDANILKDAHFNTLETDYHLACRYAFYCAQSYRDAGPDYSDQAIEWYKKCLTLKMWVQEQFVSCLRIGELYMAKKDTEQALTYFLKTVEYDNQRLEGIDNALHILRNNNQHLLVNALYHKYKHYRNFNLADKLFIIKSVYQDSLEFHNSISAYYVNDKESGYKCCKQIIIRQVLSLKLMKLLIVNFQFYIELLEKDTDSNALELFYAYDEILYKFNQNGMEIDKHVTTIWEKLFKRCRDILTKPNSSFMPMPSIVMKPNIIITFTTCKRLHLFKETVYSLLNHWLDVSKIDYWFCVDDNSLDNDRKEMVKCFPWIHYYMKPIEEKGHRKSMNIIWDKLNELKPTYWIHMEDDFLFYKKQNYIIDAINGLQTLENYHDGKIKQILFNRNYAETVSCYNSSGHEKTSDPNIIVHNYKPNTIWSFPNHICWPHFSFRPSLNVVQPILELGNFNTENTFFEKDYGEKWSNAGYKSAFFNRITSRHIGRLTYDRSVPNAYQLNGENQFNTNNESNSKYIKIINLERRLDRKQKTIEQLSLANIDETDYEFVSGEDGKMLTPTQEILELFKDNNFNYRKGVIGCALSHYNLWKQLLNDPTNNYYLIMEDDFTVSTFAKEKIELLKKNNVFLEHDILFLGYHTFEKDRKKLNDEYNDIKQVKLFHLKTEIYVGGLFAYSINKRGAQKLVEFIEKNGIKCGIDSLIKHNPSISCYECQPHIFFSEWNENGKPIDTDIQIYDKDENLI